MVRIYLPLLLFLFVSFTGISQSKKDIKEEKIMSIKTIVYDSTTGIEKTRVKKIVNYDKKGNIIEEINYDKDGKIKKHTESIYDERDNLLTRTFYFANGKVKKVNKYVYTGKLKMAKLVYDNKGKLVLKEEYIYKKADIEKE
ncbi:MAG: hypothetical protein GXO79_08160 [Chlorobi bacterium]|nr:hypothetical protein [Chlorobiota bacterium]